VLNRKKSYHSMEVPTRRRSPRGGGGGDDPAHACAQCTSARRLASGVRAAMHILTNNPCALAV